MAEEGVPLKEIGSVIPSVYYDLIARVASGAPFAVFLLRSYRSQLTEMDQLVGKTGILLVLLLGSYLAGMVLTPISGIFELPFLWFSRRALDLKKYSLARGSYERARLIAEVLGSDKEAAATETKMAAEAVLFQNLLAGFVIMLILRCVHWVYFSLSPAKSAVLLLWLLIGLVHRKVVHINRQKILFENWQRAHGGPPGAQIVPVKTS